MAIRLVHRCSFVPADEPLIVTNEESLEKYAPIYIKKRLKNLYESDLGYAGFLEDSFYWDEFRNMKRDSLGYFFRMNTIKKLKNRRETFLSKWIDFMQ